MFFSSVLGAGRGNLTETSDGFWRGLLGGGRNSTGVRVTPESALGLPI
ncbi:phage portal protein, partial [Pseudomonas sp. GW247-3R2A]